MNVSHMLNVEALANVYWVSNTPAYLFRHYRNNPTVQEFAEIHSVEQLVSFIAQVANTELAKRKIEDIVLAYASIVGLTFKNPSIVKKKTRKLSFERIYWGDAILRLWEPYPTVSGIISGNATITATQEILRVEYDTGQVADETEIAVGVQ